MPILTFYYIFRHQIWQTTQTSFSVPEHKPSVYITWNIWLFWLLYLVNSMQTTNLLLAYRSIFFIYHLVCQQSIQIGSALIPCQTKVFLLKSDNLQYKYTESLGWWDDRLIDQASDVPSIIFFHKFLQNSWQKSF